MWTKNAPTEAGWYWWMRDGDFRAQAVYLISGNAVWLVGVDVAKTAGKLGGEWWSEPIAKPKGEGK